MPVSFNSLSFISLATFYSNTYKDDFATGIYCYNLNLNTIQITADGTSDGGNIKPMKAYFIAMGI